MAGSDWSEQDIPDQSGRVAVVTGASSGIGLEAARALAAQGATVILAVRDAEKGRNAEQAILKQYPEAVLEVRPLDLADLESVAQFAADLAADCDRLDLLINNAGVMMCPFAQTRDGFEIQFGTNHLGHFALTGRLLPVLQKTAGSRVVVVSSLAHRGGRLDFEDLNWAERKYNTIRAYCDSKLANLLFTLALAERLSDAGDRPLVTAAHPGWSRTDLQRHVWKFRWLGLLLGQNSRMGALPTLRAAVDEAAWPGDFFGPAGRREMTGPPVKVDPAAKALDRAAARRLWAISEELTGVRY